MKTDIRYKWIAGMFFLFTVLSHMSCSESKRGVDPVDEPKEKGHISFAIQLDNRSADNTPNDWRVNDVRIVLYDATGPDPNISRVKYCFDFDISSPESWNGENDGWVTSSSDDLYEASGDLKKFTSFAREVDKQEYRMLVIINGKEMTSSGDGNTLYDVTGKENYYFQLNTAASVDIDPETGFLAGGSGILMVNAEGQSLTPVTADQIKSTALEANTNPVQVSLDRFVGKIKVVFNGGAIPAGIVDNTIKWTLGVTNKKAYWLRKPASGNETGDRSAWYAEDPNYDPVSSRADHFDYTTKTLGPDGEGYFVKISNVNKEFGESLYAPENTISSSSLNELLGFKDMITEIVIGYQYVPDRFLPGESYYIYNNYCISQINMTRFVNGNSDEPQVLAGLLESIARTNTDIYPLDGSAADFFEVHGIRYCPEGYIYRTIPIEHFGGNPEDFGCYGVLRNNTYTVKITAIHPPQSWAPEPIRSFARQPEDRQPEVEVQISRH